MAGNIELQRSARIAEANHGSHAGTSKVVVVPDTALAVHSMLLSVRRHTGALTQHQADEQADRIIKEWVIQIASLGFIPAHINWIFMNTVNIINIVRMSQVYGISTSKDDAGKLLKGFLLLLGPYAALFYMGAKAFYALIETTGAGYFLGSTIDAATSSAAAFAFGQTAKAYFGGQHSDKTLGNIMRSSLKKAKRDLSRDKLREMASESGMLEYSSDYLYEMATSPFGAEIITLVVSGFPETYKSLEEFLMERNLAGIDALAREDISALAKSGNLAAEIWTILTSEVDVARLRELAHADQVDVQLGRRLGALLEAGIGVVTESDAIASNGPLGQLERGTVYARHPLRQDVYLPLSEFHRRLFVEKRNDLLTLLRCLGATEVRVTREYGYRVNATGHAGATGGTYVPAAAQLQGGLTSGSSEAETWQARYTPIGQPSMPAECLWLDQELEWQQLARDRIAGGLTDITLRLAYEHDFGVNAELSGRIQACGFSGGGGGSEYERTQWSVHAEFA